MESIESFRKRFPWHVHGRHVEVLRWNWRTSTILLILFAERISWKLSLSAYPGLYKEYRVHQGVNQNGEMRERIMAGTCKVLTIILHWYWQLKVKQRILTNRMSAMQCPTYMSIYEFYLFFITINSLRYSPFSMREYNANNVWHRHLPLKDIMQWNMSYSAEILVIVQFEIEFSCVEERQLSL